MLADWTPTTRQAGGPGILCLWNGALIARDITLGDAQSLYPEAEIFFRALSLALCTCAIVDDGDGESGPHLSVTPHETCRIHGREADPEGWAKDDAIGAAWTL